MAKGMDYDKVLELKALVDERFSLYLHMHDSCAQQSFYFEEPQGQEVWDCIRDFMSAYHYSIDINSDNTTCWIV